jgi:hypothetical protein
MAIRNARTGVNISDANAAVSEVAAGKTFYSVVVPKKTGTMANVALNPALNAYPAGYHAGAPSLTAVDADLIPSNIKLGKTLFGVVGTMVQWVYDLVITPLTIPVPTIALLTNEAHSGGGQMDPHALTAPVPAIALIAENSMLLIDNCEAVWNEYVGANVTSTLDNVDYKVGAGSAKLDIADLQAVGRIATHDNGPNNLTTYSYIKMWIKSTVAISNGDLNFLLDEHAQCVSPLKTLNIGALSAGVWTELSLALGDASGLGAIISYGVIMAVDKGAFIVRIDQVRATKGA